MALTDAGERCSRSAQDDGFCHQHDGSGPTVDDAGDDDSEQAQNDGTEEMTDGGSTSSSEESVDTDDSVETDVDAEDEQSADEQPEGDESERSTSESGEAEDDLASVAEGSTLQRVRKAAEVIGRDLIGHNPDGISGISRTDDGWLVTIEVVERSAVPDTQDILGRYEITLDSDFEPTDYRRLERFRRGDTERSNMLE